jgi:hypothetical protein
MTVANALASMAVGDLSVARGWYEALLGESNQPMPEVIEWQFERGGGLQVYQGADRAGHGSCTLIVDDIAALASRLDAVGISGVEPMRHDQVDTTMIKDPDGNSIAFSAPKDDSLAR